MRLLDDPKTAPLVTELIKKDGGIARLANEAWLAVSAPQGVAAEAVACMFGLPCSALCGCSPTPRPRRS